MSVCLKLLIHKKRFTDGGYVFYTTKYGRLLNRAIYHNNEQQIYLFVSNLSVKV